MVQLFPFAKTPSKVSVKADLVFEKDLFHFLFSWQDPEESLDPLDFRSTGAVSNYQRQDEIWKMNCFEAFVALEDNPESYWEFNISPRGHWNVYYFETYRQPQPPQADRSFQVNFFKKSDHDLKMSLQSQNQRWTSSQNFMISFCSILKIKSTDNDLRETVYFSNKHILDRPDFHQKSAREILRKRGGL